MARQLVRYALSFDKATGKATISKVTGKRAPKVSQLFQRKFVSTRPAIKWAKSIGYEPVGPSSTATMWHIELMKVSELND